MSGAGRNIKRSATAWAKAQAAQTEELARLQERASQQRELARASKSAGEWRALARAHLAELEHTQARLQVLLALKEDQLVKRVKLPPASHTLKGNESIVCLIASDWHVEEHVDPATVQGRNAYNLEIAESRLDHLWRNAVRLTNGARSDAKIQRLVVFLLGDLYSGWIHEELRSTTDLSPIDSVLWLRPRVEAGLNYLAEHGDFKTIDVVCKVGNHSRITTQQYASPERASLEWLLYQWLATRYEGHSQIRFHLTPSHHTVVELVGVRVRCHHGDSFKYRGGVAGVTVPLAVHRPRWDQAELADFDVMGHWHQYTPGARWCINGSLIGFSPYAARVGGYEPPQQAWFLVSEKYRRVTLQAPVFVE